MQFLDSAPHKAHKSVTKFKFPKTLYTGVMSSSYFELLTSMPIIEDSPVLMVVALLSTI